MTNPNDPNVEVLSRAIALSEAHDTDVAIVYRNRRKCLDAEILADSFRKPDRVKHTNANMIMLSYGNCKVYLLSKLQVDRLRGSNCRVLIGHETFIDGDVGDTPILDLIYAIDGRHPSHKVKDNG